MKSLPSIVVTTSSFVRGLELVLLAVLVLTAVVLILRDRGARARAHAGADMDHGDRPRRRRRRASLAIAIVLLLTCQVLTISVAAARVNTRMQFASTLGDIAGLVSGSPSSRTARLGDTTPEASDVTTAPDAWVAAMSPASDGFVKTTFTGPISGISQEVWAWTPQGYSPTDGKTYNVIVFLHGDPGTPDGVASTLKVASSLQQAIDAGTIPPTIFVVPSLNADDTQRTQPDCANIVGHAQVGTWVQAEVPAMIKATYPNVTTNRDGWAISGLSSGAYCSLWTGISRSDTYGTIMAMSGYDVPVLGGMSTSDRLRQQNSLSAMLPHDSHQPLNIWVMGAQDDPDAYSLAQNLPTVAPSQDHVTPALVPSGGHSWTLWAAQFPEALSWWGSALKGEVTASSSPSPDTAMTRGATQGDASGGLVPRVTASVTGIRGNGLLAVLGVTALALSVLAVRPWGARRRRAGSGVRRRPGVVRGAGALWARLTALWRRMVPTVPLRRLVRRRDGEDVGGAGLRRRVIAGEVVRGVVRSVVLVAACLVAAFFVGVVANRLGGFYPSWSLAWDDLGGSLL